MRLPVILIFAAVTGQTPSAPPPSLTFTPTAVPQEGWHQLKVSLKDARGDVTARPAYFVAPKER